MYSLLSNRFRQTPPFLCGDMSTCEGNVNRKFEKISLEMKILCTTTPYLFMACLLAKDKVNGLTTQRPLKRGKEHKMKDKKIFERLLLQIGSIHIWEMTKLAPSCTQKQPNINTFSSLMVLLAMYLVESYDQCTCSC